MIEGLGMMEWGINGYTKTVEKEVGGSVLRRIGSNQEFKDQIEQSEKGLYQGNWKANKMHGFGCFRWASGKIYIGNWTADVKNGVGKLSFKGGNDFTGEF